jgi:hypothetical protein
VNSERALAVLGGPPQTARTVRAISWPTFARDLGGYELGGLGQPTGGSNLRPNKKRFEDKTTIYYFLATDNIQTAHPEKYMLVGFEDMAEGVGAPLPQNVEHQDLAAAKCVIEILSDWNIAVPPEWWRYDRAKLARLQPRTRIRLPAG